MIKKLFLNPIYLLVLVAFLFATNVSVAQERKKETIDAKATSTKSPDVDKLKKPSGNKKGSGPAEPKSRGDIYGADYSDIVVANSTPWYVDIYVDGEYRGTLSPWDKRVTWAIPGNTKLYAVATFDDGSYSYWGPNMAKTGYSYTWNLTQ